MTFEVVAVTLAQVDAEIKARREQDPGLGESRVRQTGPGIYLVTITDSRSGAGVRRPGSSPAALLEYR